LLIDRLCRSLYRRYAIAEEALLRREAGTKLLALHRGEATKTSKVITLR
jgi:hypothetical protein